jgi:hypothetical protein
MRSSTLEQRRRRRGLQVDADTVKPLSMGDALDIGIAVGAWSPGCSPAPDPAAEGR